MVLEIKARASHITGQGLYHWAMFPAQTSSFLFMFFCFLNIYLWCLQIYLFLVIYQGPNIKPPFFYDSSFPTLLLVKLLVKYMGTKAIKALLGNSSWPHCVILFRTRSFLHGTPDDYSHIRDREHVHSSSNGVNSLLSLVRGGGMRACICVYVKYSLICRSCFKQFSILSYLS